MSIKTILILDLLLISFICGINQSCSKDKAPNNLDAELFEMAKQSSGFTWYKNTNILLNKSPESGHAPPLLRTRYNSIAASKIDLNGKVISGSTFPEGSLIVKELVASSTSLERYAIMYKNSSHEYADSNGWIWGYINANGSVAIPASTKGVSCINCHSQVENIDYTLMNKSFP